MTDVQDAMTKLGKANQLMEDLIDLAMEDQNISEDEKNMLFSINNNLAAYAKMIVEVISDGKMDEKEKAKLNQLEQKIITDAQQVAQGDTNISDEERSILNQVISVIEEI